MRQKSETSTSTLGFLPPPLRTTFFFGVFAFMKENTRSMYFSAAKPWGFSTRQIEAELLLIKSQINLFLTGCRLLWAELPEHVWFKREGSPSSRLSPVPLSINSLSPVLPSLDVTDRRGTARSLFVEWIFHYFSTGNPRRHLLRKQYQALPKSRSMIARRISWQTCWRETLPVMTCTWARFILTSVQTCSVSVATIVNAGLITRNMFNEK